MEVAWDVLGVSGPSSPAPSQEISNAGLLAVIEALECQLGITDEPSTPTFWATIEERRPGWGVDLITTSGPSHQRQFGGPLGRIVSEQYPFNLTEYLKTYDVKNNVTYKGEGWISIPESGEYTFILHASRPHSGNCFHSMSIAGVELFPPQVVKFDAGALDKVLSKLVDMGAGDFEYTTEYYCSFWCHRSKETRI